LSISKIFKEGSLYILLLFTISFLSCEPGIEKVSSDPSLKLSFSQDTVIFDTIFTSIGSITKRFKVYNRNKEAVNISNIRVAGDLNSPYTIFVNGDEGKEFLNTQIFGEDSILILVKAKIDPTIQNMPFVVEDSVLFNTNGNDQQVKLLAWGQNAHFLNDSIIACNSTWQNDKPYVIINSVLVDSLCTLTIEKGVRIFLHNNSNFYVGGKLIVQGAPNENVIFTNDRLDEPYKSTPGQWNGIFFLEGSKGNAIDYTTIRNSQYGIWLGTPDDDSTPDLVLTNSIIENVAIAGLICFTSDLDAYNLVIDNCGQYTLANFAGGNYNYTHLTIANYSFDFVHNNPSIVFTDNLDLSDGSVIKGDLNVNIVNSILWGSLNSEVGFDLSDQLNRLTFYANYIKTQNDTFALHNTINVDPQFVKPELFDYKLDSMSPAIDAGVSTFVLKDIEGKDRGLKPDLGAYELIK